MHLEMFLEKIKKVVVEGSRINYHKQNYCKQTILLYEYNWLSSVREAVGRDGVQQCSLVPS